MKNYTRQFKKIFLLFFLTNTIVFSQVKLPKLISDGMVLQRNADVKIWGWAAVNEKVSVNFINSTYTAVADSNGEWTIKLPKLKAGGPYTMKINASNEVIINDIVVGDVWLCSGQSNMEINMQRVSPIYETEIANSENPNIRYFEIPDKYNFNNPEKDVQWGKWEKANPNSVLKFSAVAYFFAKEINNKYKIPVGLINSALGGAPAEAWISEEAIKEFPNYFEEAQLFKDSSHVNKIDQRNKRIVKEWYGEVNRTDEGYKNGKPWYSPDYTATGWDKMMIPGYWSKEKIGPVNGVFWFRKEIEVPSSAAGKPAKLELGRIVDADSVFINGVLVGNTGYQYPPRRYQIPSGVLKEGKNLIAVRLFSNSGNGGFVEDKNYEITVDGQKIDLKGEWQYRLGAKMNPLESEIFIRWKPVGLYNGMIAPLVNYSIKGVIWYQGEANTDKALEYQKLFPALIKDWRDKWNRKDLPFLYVQLPNFMENKEEPSESNWALLRESQLKSLSVPYTAMAVAIDLGEWNDIHPLNKKDVGIRLALAAQKIAYGHKKIIHSGPVYKSMKIEKNKIVLTFENTGSGLIVKGGGDLKQFAISGPDKQFVWANAKIEKNKVIVWSDKITEPVAVRYAWADNPEGANLYNKEGLPASPFRTDEF